MIIREKYLSKIRPFYDVDLIKVITGIRRCGKSVIMNQIIDEVKMNNNNSNIIYLNFELKEYSFIKDDNALYEYVKNKITDKKKNYLFFDEIQNVLNWELAINSFKAEYKDNVSIFLTGSNSDLLSSELATHIAGRYVSFNILPFSFEEVCIYKNVNSQNIYELQPLFDDYMKWGGMPQRFIFEDESQVRLYLTDVFNSIVIKDIVERFKIKDIDLFNRIIEYVVTTPAQTFSADKLSKFFESESRSVSKNTLYNYLEYMDKSLLINKVDRYDVRGKRILNGKYKYYLTDLGLGRVMSASKKEQLGAYIENIVYNELIYRGYEVKIGSLENAEIDFIATKDGKKEYYQVCYLIGDNEDTRKREFGAYSSIYDNYPKYVISNDTFDLSENGIIHFNIIKWLLGI
jgi:predicted AAA+ superfamily ATPase